ncbi:hypothetical protein V1278_003789 [Bradyrhizobium sp. AZCC 1577]|uniref:hypothetical protein n=1 Tax=Bradyrhizobium sp. AZCC 1577 TaxID=3117019 RepID=UPI002FEED84F
MRREYDLLAICMLMLTLTLIGAMATDPKGFSVQSWQPLIAALIALGGASMVYRGATLAYRAAMAKVSLDREEAERERNIERLGLFLRLSTSLYSVIGSISGCVYLIDEKETETPSEVLVLDPRQLKVYNPPELSDAWNKIHLLPDNIITDIAVLIEMLARLEEELIEHKDEKWTIEFSEASPNNRKTRRPPEYLRWYSQQCQSLSSSCERIIDTLKPMIPGLRKYD